MLRLLCDKPLKVLDARCRNGNTCSYGQQAGARQDEHGKAKKGHGSACQDLHNSSLRCRCCIASAGEGGAGGFVVQVLCMNALRAVAGGGSGIARRGAAAAVEGGFVGGGVRGFAPARIARLRVVVGVIRHGEPHFLLGKLMAYLYPTKGMFNYLRMNG